MELALIIEQFERVVSEGVEPPSWMKVWGDHGCEPTTPYGGRPRAIGAACTLRAAAMMTETEHLSEARALYQHVLTRYSSRDLTDYVDQS
jgi:hypothetical protein